MTELNIYERKNLFKETLRDREHATTLPPKCYTDPDFFRLEVERIFRKEWVCIGRTDVLRNF